MPTWRSRAQQINNGHMCMNPATFDADADAAYFPVAGQIGPGHAVENVVIERSAGTVVLDFDADGYLLGVEVVGASSLLRTSTIETLNPSG